MANIAGTNIASAVRPFTTEDKYPVALMDEIKGGLHSVPSLTGIDVSLPLERRQEGMWIACIDTNKIYKWTSFNSPNLYWQEMVLPFTKTINSIDDFNNWLYTGVAFITGYKDGIYMANFTGSVLKQTVIWDNKFLVRDYDISANPLVYPPFIELSGGTGTGLPTIAADFLTDFDTVDNVGLYSIVGDLPGLYIGNTADNPILRQMVIWDNKVLVREIDLSENPIVYPAFTDLASGGGSVDLTAYLQKLDAEKLYSPIILEATGDEPVITLESVTSLPDIATQEYPGSIGRKYYNPEDGKIYEVFNPYSTVLAYQVPTLPEGGTIYRTAFNEYRYALINNIFTRVKVISAVVDSTITTVASTGVLVGGIPIGTNLVGKTLDEFADMLCNPELFPTLTAPSTSMTLSPSATYQEVGAVINLVLTPTFNRGAINPQYTAASPYRAGALNYYQISGSGISGSSVGQSPVTLSNYIVTLGANTWYLSTFYLIGVQPKSSKGNDYSTPLAAGSVGIAPKYITGVYPLYATTATITVLTKAALQAHGSDITVSMKAEDGTNKQTIQIPQAWGTIAVLQQYNTLSGTWDAIDLASFTKTATTVGGVAYWEYSHNGSTIGARQLKFKL